MATQATKKPKKPLTVDQIGDVLGLQEVGVLLEMDRRTSHAWFYRQRLPVPDFESINGLRAWKRKTILKWAVETGRLPASGSLDEETASIKGVRPAYRGGRQAAAKAREDLAKAAEL